MEDKRAKTFEALESFIQSQKALLARTESDITRLRQLRNDAIARPTHFMMTLDQEFAEDKLRLSDQCDAQVGIPSNVDWSLYEAHDPKVLQDLAIDAQQKHEQRNKPFRYQRSELSELQKLVKEARRTIVDPILTLFESMSEPEDEEEMLSPQEIRREREREKICQLKKRKIHTLSGLRLPSGGLSGIFVRREAEDESIDVDVIHDDTSTPYNSTCSAIGIQRVSAPVILPASSSNSQPQWPPKFQRDRKPSRKAQAQDESAKVIAHSRKQKEAMSPPAQDENSRGTPAEASKPRNPDKPRSETYKQAWSVSEQHLLEQLLEQIPDGEKNRWQKISRAMNGRRTPRQVASRVQKYFEKLKRFGLEGG